MEKLLMKGNEAIGTAAIKSGCKYFFGYPITPQNEIPEFMSKELPKVGGCFIQAESEVAAVNMVYGAAGTGARCMTSSSSPGMSLKQEGISYLVGAELPCLIVNVMRGGPGLGGIQPSQADYFQATRGGGNGDYYMPVFAPATVQETVDLIEKGFDLADEYRTPVMMLIDGMTGQMMEPVRFSENENKKKVDKPWATTGTKGKRKPNIINSLYLKPEELEKHCDRLFEKYDKIKEEHCLWEENHLDDAEIVLVAYGTTSRITKNVMNSLREKGKKVGMIRPITVWPFPYKAIEELKDNVKDILVVEMSKGQMIEDVRLGNEGRKKVHFYGRTGGMIPTPEEIALKVEEILEKGGNK
ncbi:3-methyl-2-oxobutanoate dehydrogenase subunit VorB [uncultured Cetobacterium sp.]|uniref:3-methyl-2-oxobutanoate dehydrogenase subunit VorB n=1 Tax=uncultured Cetobacterium sp. TaxID=527638 RepID=UPI002630A04D|nr:3-methyl-2-oxobutanoate dehydrogenase subunit VorB [uncultured Cetobacterium sp.]